MALDTRNKRASALGLIAGLALVLPTADSSIAQADRQQVAFSYSGIAASTAAVSVSAGEASTWVGPRRKTTWRV